MAITTITAAAKRILREHHGSPYGTEIPFQADGKRYVARIERHYHPPGGPRRTTSLGPLSSAGWGAGPCSATRWTGR